MTKRDVIEVVAQRSPQFSLHQIEILVDAFFATLTEALANGERIEVRGFGSFALKARAARTARNPKTGAEVTVEAKRIPFFKVGKELRQRLNPTAPARTKRSTRARRAGAP